VTSTTINLWVIHTEIVTRNFLFLIKMWNKLFGLYVYTNGLIYLSNFPYLFPFSEIIYCEFSFNFLTFRALDSAFIFRWHSICPNTEYVISVTDPYGRILGILDRSRYHFFRVALQLYLRGWVGPVPGPLLLIKSGSAGNRTRTSGSVARNSDHQTTEAVTNVVQWPFLACQNTLLLQSSI
jgi:hypothetical protein